MSHAVCSVLDQTFTFADFEVIVVNDGSHDKTPEIARQFKEVSLISYTKNRGYGAAIKNGFEKATGTIVSFLDADGTCDPNYFVDMCSILITEGADIVIGSRMTSERATGVPRSSAPTTISVGASISPSRSV